MVSFHCSFFILILCNIILCFDGYTLQQTTDHFNPEDLSTFTQYYWINSQYYKDNGPILLYLSNYPAPSLDLQRSAISSWGNSLNALLIELEVRYSGASNPSQNFTSETFRYQTPQQNLADIIFFRQHIISVFPLYNRLQWIVIGEYFNANYAIWAREKYPNVILGSIGIAGPVEARNDFFEYSKYWATIAGDTCASLIHDATVETEIIIDADPAQSSAVKNLFGCTDVNDNTQFFYVVAQLIQFGIANYREFVCSTLQDNQSASSLVEAYAEVISSLLAYSGQPDCNAWNIASDTNPDEGYRPTFYLDCGFFGQFETAGIETQTTIVSQRLTVQWYLSICKLLFGVTLIPDVTQTNTVYGAKSPWGSNYAFVTSTSDPFRSLVINETNLENSDIIRVTTGESIFSFLEGLNTTANIQEGRNQVLSLMETWLDTVTDVSTTVSPSSSRNSPSKTVSASNSQFAPQSILNSDNSISESNNNWTLYLYMTVGILCAVAVIAIITWIILQYSQVIINSRNRT